MSGATQHHAFLRARTCRRRQTHWLTTLSHRLSMGVIDAPNDSGELKQKAGNRKSKKEQRSNWLVASRATSTKTASTPITWRAAWMDRGWVQRVHGDKRSCNAHTDGTSKKGPRCRGVLGKPHRGATQLTRKSPFTPTHSSPSIGRYNGGKVGEGGHTQNHSRAPCGQQPLPSPPPSAWAHPSVRAHDVIAIAAKALAHAIATQ